MSDGLYLRALSYLNYILVGFFTTKQYFFIRRITYFMSCFYVKKLLSIRLFCDMHRRRWTFAPLPRGYPSRIWTTPYDAAGNSGTQS